MQPLVAVECLLGLGAEVGGLLSGGTGAGLSNRTRGAVEVYLRLTDVGVGGAKGVLPPLHIQTGQQGGDSGNETIGVGLDEVSEQSRGEYANDRKRMESLVASKRLSGLSAEVGGLLSGGTGAGLSNRTISAIEEYLDIKDVRMGASLNIATTEGLTEAEDNLFLSDTGGILCHDGEA